MPTNISKSMKRDNDELYTPRILVEVIVPFIEKYLTMVHETTTIWCPFDTANSEFVLVLKEKFPNLKIIHSHINEPNGDFFSKIEQLPNKNFLVISNPPFSKKLDIIKKLNEKNLQWALCMNLESLNYQVIGNYFADNPIGLIIPDKKISFDGNCSSFNTSYFCSPGFYKGVKFVHCLHNNQGKNFVPSRMYKN